MQKLVSIISEIDVKCTLFIRLFLKKCAQTLCITIIKSITMVEFGHWISPILSP